MSSYFLARPGSSGRWAWISSASSRLPTSWSIWAARSEQLGSADATHLRARACNSGADLRRERGQDPLPVQQQRGEEAVTDSFEASPPRFTTASPMALAGRDERGQGGKKLIRHFLVKDCHDVRLQAQGHGHVQGPRRERFRRRLQKMKQRMQRPGVFRGNLLQRAANHRDQIRMALAPEHVGEVTRAGSRHLAARPAA